MILCILKLFVAYLLIFYGMCGRFHLPKNILWQFVLITVSDIGKFKVFRYHWGLLIYALKCFFCGILFIFWSSFYVKKTFCVISTELCFILRLHMWQIYVSCITCDIYYVWALICGRFSAYDYCSCRFYSFRYWLWKIFWSLMACVADFMWQDIICGTFYTFNYCLWQISCI